MAHLNSERKVMKVGLLDLEEALLLLNPIEVFMKTSKSSSKPPPYIIVSLLFVRYLKRDEEEETEDNALAVRSILIL
jgi:hypothetical protein